MPMFNSKSKSRRRFTSDRLFNLIGQQHSIDQFRSLSTNETEQTTDQFKDIDIRSLWCLLSQMIRERLLKHEPCLLPEVGAFVLVDSSSTDNANNLTKEPFFVLDTTFARRHRLSRIKKPNLSSALSLSLQANGKSTYIEPNTTLSSFNMQTLDYQLLQNQSGLTREQLMTAISQLFSMIDQEIHPHHYCDLEFPQLGFFRISFGLATFEFNDSFISEFKLTLDQTNSNNK